MQSGAVYISGNSLLGVLKGLSNSLPISNRVLFNTSDEAVFEKSKLIKQIDIRVALQLQNQLAFTKDISHNKFNTIIVQQESIIDYELLKILLEMLSLGGYIILVCENFDNEALMLKEINGWKYCRIENVMLDNQLFHLIIITKDSFVKPIRLGRNKRLEMRSNND